MNMTNFMTAICQVSISFFLARQTQQKSTTAPIPAHSKPQPSRSDANSSAPVRPDTNGYTTAYKIRNDVRKYDEGGRDGAVYQEDDMDQGSAERRALRFLARNGYVAHSEVGGGCGEGFVCVWGLMVTQLELYGF